MAGARGNAGRYQPRRWRRSIGRRSIVIAVGCLVAIAAGTLSAVAATRGTPNPNWPKAKQAKLQQLLDEQAAARARHTPKPPIPQRARPEPIPPRVGGLIQGLKQSPLPPTEFQSNSTWSGPVRGSWIQVYAGSDVTRSSPVGELRLYSMPINPNDGPDIANSLGAFAPPTAVRSLAITGVNGDLLTLQSPSGQSFEFNVATDTWGTA